MKPDDLMWDIFCNTGRIGDYLFYNELTKTAKRDEYVSDTDERAYSSQHGIR